jgi:plastocyanin
MRGRTTGTLLLVAAVLLVGSCAGDAGRASDGQLQVTMRDYAFEPAAWVLEADTPTTLVLTNVDDVGHDLSIGRSVIEEEDGDPVGYVEDFLAAADARVTPTTAEHRAERADNVIVTVAPDTTVEVTITPTTDQVGEWDVGCFSGGGCHYEAGLQGTLTVEE